MKTCKIDINLKSCNCTYGYCDKKGNCCDCIKYHKQNKELPACYFPNDIEKTYDRSISRFLELYKK